NSRNAFTLRGTPICGVASNVSARRELAQRAGYSSAVVSAGGFDAQRDQSHPERAHRLVLVCGFTNSVRLNCRLGDRAHSKDRDHAKLATGRTSGNRSSEKGCRSEWLSGETAAMKRHAIWLPAGLAILLLGCSNRPEQFILPDQVSDFAALYESNCAGCHGRDGHFGAARPLKDPLFLALIGKEKLRDVIAKGVAGTAMPAFAQNAGGGLTEQQITILAEQIEEHWSRAQEFAAIALPPYSTDLGDS